MTDDRPRFLRELRPIAEPRPLAGPVVSPGDANGYAQAAYADEVARVRAAHVGTRNDTLNVAAFNLAQLVASGHLRREDAWNGLYDAALSAGLTDKETTATLLSGFRGGEAHPREVPERPADAARGPLSDPEESPGAPGPGGDGTEAEGDGLLRYPEPLDWIALWEAEDEEEEWIVAPIIPARRLVALYSQAKAGKSLLMLEVAVGVSTGSTVLGYQPERPRRVLYVDLENDPRGDIRTRLQQMGHKPADLGNLIYLSFPDLPMLDTAMGATVLLGTVEHYEAEVVVIDTISRLVAGEENDNNTWLAFYRHTGRLLKAHGLTCVRLDHSGKDPTRGMRGGSAKYSDVDLVWSLTNPAEGIVHLECTAQRLPVRERFVTLTRTTDPWLHHVVGAEARAVAYEAERDDLTRVLDRLIGDTTSISLTAACRVLTKNGHGRRRQDVAIMLRDRSQALVDRGLAFDLKYEEPS